MLNKRQGVNDNSKCFDIFNHIARQLCWSADGKSYLGILALCSSVQNVQNSRSTALKPFQWIMSLLKFCRISQSFYVSSKFGCKLVTCSGVVAVLWHTGHTYSTRIRHLECHDKKLVHFSSKISDTDFYEDICRSRGQKKQIKSK